MTTHGLERHHPGNLRDKKISEEFRYPTSPPSDRPGRFMQYTRSIRVMKEDWISPDHSRGIVSYLTILINGCWVIRMFPAINLQVGAARYKDE